jgi:hypothetical protein
MQNVGRSNGWQRFMDAADVHPTDAPTCRDMCVVLRIGLFLQCGMWRSTPASSEVRHSAQTYHYDCSSHWEIYSLDVGCENAVLYDKVSRNQITYLQPANSCSSGYENGRCGYCKSSSGSMLATGFLIYFNFHFRSPLFNLRCYPHPT